MTLPAYDVFVKVGERRKERSGFCVHAATFEDGRRMAAGILDVTPAQVWLEVL